MASETIYNCCKINLPKKRFLCENDRHFQNYNLLPFMFQSFCRFLFENSSFKGSGSKFWIGMRTILMETLRVIISFFQNRLIYDFIISSYLTMIENMNGGSLKLWKSLSFPYKNFIFGKLILQHLLKVSEANIWFLHFELNVLEGDMVSFTGACPISSREGEAKFWITLYSSHWQPEYTFINLQRVRKVAVVLSRMHLYHILCNSRFYLELLLVISFLVFMVISSWCIWCICLTVGLVEVLVEVQKLSPDCMESTGKFQIWKEKHNHNG